MTVCGDSEDVIRPLPFARILADGFRDGRHELSPLCPGTCGACPRCGGDIRQHRQDHRQGRPALTPDRVRPSGFGTGPARAPGKSPRAGCPGHHLTYTSTRRCPAASRTPPIAPGRQPVEGFSLLQTTSAFSRKRVALSGTDDWRDRAQQSLSRSRICSLLAQAFVREKWEVGKEIETARTSFPGPRHKAGGSRGTSVRQTRRRQSCGTANFANAATTCS